MPCVLGSASRIMTGTNLFGSSVTTPDAVSPANPTPFAEPIPARKNAMAAPRNAQKSPLFFKTSIMPSIRYFLPVRFDFAICGFNSQGVKGLSPALEEFSKKLYILKPAGMYICSQGIYQEIKGMSYYKHNNENQQAKNIVCTGH